MTETFSPPSRPPDYADVFSGALAEPHLRARALLVRSLSDAPGWFRALSWLRNVLVRPLGLKTGAGPDKAAGVGALAALPVVHDTDAHFASGLSDKHLDFLLSIKKTGGADPQVSITTQIWFNAALGHVYLMLILPFHKAIIRHFIRKLGAPS